ncbi:MAG: hypothetical protein Ta2F_17770 [Termitinemataceae bacterium]|nr:MAG: hypothetical protein Ta2F_17770 [Termitinemataceae bacterium]
MAAKKCPEVLFDDKSINVSKEVAHIWSIANTLRPTYTELKYGDVITPMIIIRRLECALDKTKKSVISAYKRNKETPPQILMKLSGFSFYNTSRFSLKELLNDSKNLAANFENYLNGFSANIQDIIHSLEFTKEIDKLAKSNRLYGVINKFSELDSGRAAIICNGSPLFSGGTTSGESQIRRYMLENDLIEAIMALPTDLFYNTGIGIYAFILSKNKRKERRGKIQLINAVNFYKPLRKSLGKKRREISNDDMKNITQIYVDFSENENCKIFAKEEFLYKEFSVYQPLQRNYAITDERIEKMIDDGVLSALNDNDAVLHDAIIKVLKSNTSKTVYKNKEAFFCSLYFNF